MNAVLPIGHVTLLKAAEMLLPAMYAGVQDLPIVTSLRQEGISCVTGPFRPPEETPPRIADTIVSAPETRRPAFPPLVLFVLFIAFGFRADAV
jgi:hypothetical protein